MASMTSRRSCIDPLSLTYRSKADVSKTYIDWAVRHGFAVMDVNVPRHYTEPDVCALFIFPWAQMLRRRRIPENTSKQKTVRLEQKIRENWLIICGKTTYCKFATLLSRPAELTHSTQPE